MSDKNSPKQTRLSTKTLDPRVAEAQKRLGKRIRALREARGYTQDKLSSLAGFTQKYLGEVERGAGNITIELLTKLADALGVPLSVVLETEHEQTHEELTAEINRMAPLLSSKDAQLVYRMMRMLTGQ